MIPNASAELAFFFSFFLGELLLWRRTIDEIAVDELKVLDFQTACRLLEAQVVHQVVVACLVVQRDRTIQRELRIKNIDNRSGAYFKARLSCFECRSARRNGLVKRFDTTFFGDHTKIRVAGLAFSLASDSLQLLH